MSPLRFQHALHSPATTPDTCVVIHNQVSAGLGWPTYSYSPFALQTATLMEAAASPRMDSSVSSDTIREPSAASTIRASSERQSPHPAKSVSSPQVSFLLNQNPYREKAKSIFRLVESKPQVRYS